MPTGNTPLTPTIDSILGPTLPSDLLASINSINQVVNPGTGPSATLFFDYFFSDNGGAPAENFNAFLQWNVIGGSVDLVGGFGPGVFGAPPSQPTGRFVDLGGSTGDPGAFVTKQAFPVVAGQIYNLTFDYRSTTGDLNSAAATFGGQTFVVASEDANFQRFSQTFIATETGVFSLEFQNSEADRDNSGIGVDGILFGPAVGREVTPLTGSRAVDTLTGTAGQDVITGGSGSDTLSGAGGMDTLTAAPRAGETVVIFGGSQIGDPNDAADTIIVTGSGTGTVYGNGGNDLIVFQTQGAGNIFGGFGADRIEIQNDVANTVTGGTTDGDLIVIRGNGNNLVLGGSLETDPLDGSDRIVITGDGNNLVYANGGDDRVVISGSGSNTVFGGVGNDSMTGGSGADRFVGGPGDNVYTGGGGADSFVHSAGSRDIVTDFRFADGDRLDVGGQSFSTTTASDGSAALVFADGGVIILQGVTQNDFQMDYVA